MFLFAPIRGPTLETFSVDNDQTNPTDHNGLAEHDRFPDSNEEKPVWSLVAEFARIPT